MAGRAEMDGTKSYRPLNHVKTMQYAFFSNLTHVVKVNLIMKLYTVYIKMMIPHKIPKSDVCIYIPTQRVLSQPKVVSHCRQTQRLFSVSTKVHSPMVPIVIEQTVSTFLHVHIFLSNIGKTLLENCKGRGFESHRE